MNIPDNLIYTKEHEWAKVKGNTATIGITGYAQSSLGDITFIELPKVGDKVEQGKRLATVESVKAASDVYASFSGKIVKINEKLLDSSEIVNQSPYEDGWFAVIEIENEAEKGNLLSSADYKTYVEGLDK